MGIDLTSLAYLLARISVDDLQRRKPSTLTILMVGLIDLIRRLLTRSTTTKERTSISIREIPISTRWAASSRSRQWECFGTTEDKKRSGEATNHSERTSY